MVFTAARARRKVAVRLSAITSSHAWSLSWTRRLSRVMPALATRMSSLPRALSQAGTRASTASLSARSQVSTWTRPASSPASVSSASRRVPEIATFAPCACSARAIAPPMPPLAPVTSALLPVRSNIILLPSCPCHLEGGDILRSTDGHTGRTFRYALDEPGEHFAGSNLVEGRYARLRHERYALAPAHGAGYLRNQAVHDLGGIRGRPRQHIGDERHAGRLHRHLGQRFSHHLGSGLHQRGMKRGGDRQHHGAPHAFRLRDLDRALNRSLVTRHHNLPAAVVVRRLHDLALRRLRRYGSSLLEFRADQRRHRAHTHGHGLLHGAAACAHELDRIGKRQRTGRGKRRVFAD